jgi:hypothetical protein
VPRSQSSVVGITNRLWTGRSGAREPVDARDFLLASPSKPALGSTWPLFSVYRGSFPGVKRLGREVQHSLPSSAEVKNEWSCTTTPPMCLHILTRKILRVYATDTYKNWTPSTLRKGKSKRWNVCSWIGNVCFPEFFSNIILRNILSLTSI